MNFTPTQPIIFLAASTIVCHALFYLCGYKSGIRRGIELARNEIKKQTEDRSSL
jgi:hypothetical protein